MYFDGTDRERRAIRLGGRARKNEHDKSALMRRAREERLERAAAKQRQAAATKVAAWWRGRSSALKSRVKTRRAWEGQMRDLDAVRKILSASGAPFAAPPDAVRRLARAFLFFFRKASSSSDDAENTHLEAMCDLVLRYPASANSGLAARQCRGLLDACVFAVATANDSASKTAAQRLAEACAARVLSSESESSLDDDDDNGVFFFDAAHLADAVAAVGPLACSLVSQQRTHKEDDENSDRQRRRIIMSSLAAASLVAARSCRDADIARRARRAYAVRVLARPGAAFPETAGDLAAACAAATGASLEETEPIDCNGEYLAANACAAFVAFSRNAKTPSIITPVARLARAIAARLSRAALLDGVDVAREARAKATKNAADSDDDDDEDDDDEAFGARSRREPFSEPPASMSGGTTTPASQRFASGAPPRKKPVVLLDGLVAERVASERLRASNRRRDADAPSPFGGAAFWEAAFEAATAGNDDSEEDNADALVSVASLGATVVAKCDPAPRARVALANGSPRVVATLLDAAASRRDRLWKLWKVTNVRHYSLGFVSSSEPTPTPRDSDGVNVNPDSSWSFSGRGACFVLSCCALSRLLQALDDEELADDDQEFPKVADWLEIAAFIRDALRREIWVDQTLQRGPRVGSSRAYALAVAARLLNQLHDRLGKNAPQVKSPDFWLWPGVRLSERLAADDDSDERVAAAREESLESPLRLLPGLRSAEAAQAAFDRLYDDDDDEYFDSNDGGGQGDDDSGLRTRPVVPLPPVGGETSSSVSGRPSNAARDDDDDAPSFAATGRRRRRRRRAVLLQTPDAENAMSLLSEEEDEEVSDDDAFGVDADGDAKMAENFDSVALSKEPRVAQTLAAVPFVFPFEQRVALFGALVERDRERHQGDEAARFLRRVPLGVRATVRRDRVFEDAYDALAVKARDLRARVQVTFVNEAGHEEAGIDGGGVFKEFLDSCAKAAFGRVDLFESTPVDGALFPRPSFDPEHLKRVEFCGRIIGKALYERVLVEPRFATFFLNAAFLGKHNYFDDLDSRDRDLYRNLRKLKRLDADQVDGLGLCFAVTPVPEITTTTTTTVGVQNDDVELVPGGKDVAVTARNRRKYAQLVAHHRLNVEPAATSAAFLRGLRAAVPARWLRIFDPRELQTLVSGDDRPIDVDDWRKHTHYAGGFHPSQPYVQAFWDVVAGFDDATRAKLLRFVTSCSRPPLLGFARLRPLVCIHKVPRSADRLPTAGTCMNLLKLPEYDSVDTLRDRLLYAINEAHGFELS